MSYESFSILRDVFYQNRVIFISTLDIPVYWLVYNLFYRTRILQFLNVAYKKIKLNYALWPRESLLFHFKHVRNGPTGTASISLKTDDTKKIISQELKRISSNCDKHWKAYSYCTITLPLASYKRSFSISRQSESSPLRSVLAQVSLAHTKAVIFVPTYTGLI